MTTTTRCPHVERANEQDGLGRAVRCARYLRTDTERVEGWCAWHGLDASRRRSAQLRAWRASAAAEAKPGAEGVS